MIRSLRDEALLILEGRGAVLETAREVSRILCESEIDGAIIGGVAVVLHGYVRTTSAVDVFVPGEPAELAAALRSAGFKFDRAKREFVNSRVPVHLVTPTDVRQPPSGPEEIDGVVTVSLFDLINMKLDSGLRNPVRYIDLADVVGLIRHHGLTSRDAPKIAKPLRPEFRKLVKAIANETN